MNNKDIVRIQQIVIIENAKGNEHELAFHRSIVPDYFKDKHYDVEVIYIGNDKYQCTYRTDT